MLKLYKKEKNRILYWETWKRNFLSGIIHWGIVGQQGEDKTIKSGPFRSYKNIIKKEIDIKLADGYKQIDIEDHDILVIEYPVKGMGTMKDLKKRYRLQKRMDQTLGWTGLGHCDGGSIGSDTMEVCCFVVQFEIAKEIVSNDLKNTEFSDYIKIYKSN